MSTQTETASAVGKKTWKRELAVLLLVFWAYIVYGGDVDMVEAITFPVFFYVLGAFGMDAYSKQLRQ